ncbi:hypothetical protein BTV54_00135 [Pasteurella multocida subsp. multocida]|uniref:hypothetical protein n=2 Tax=Pasteurella multocida TaxID=747 RepID=UPI00099B4BF3|nr:hypothetical protein [Pasteurella multocida]MCL7828436.1 hypothetical protein [Pasteurella multocida]OPC87110.1 hypothetical protein BTV54_00135 [Pasteurella multocida subsp. multocida]OPC98266.1 hypothetical protein BTV55_00135 [Pasteurella multocida subsp. multocida]HEA3272388.1 hypothetical protein [Pasteurella multocida]
MIRITNEINILMDKIVSLNIAKGIQPSELSESFFDDEYSSIIIEKSHNYVYAIVSFTDTDEQNNTSQHLFRYTYNKEKQLLQIEEKLNNKAYKTVWNRSKTLESLYVELSDKLLELNPKQKVNDLLKQIPQPEIYRIFQKLRLVA